MKNIVYLIYLSVCSAKIYINVKTSPDLNKTEVEYTGSDYKLVTDEEVAMFNITHENLNRGIKVEMGKVPDDIYLRDPTPYEDLFNIFEWPQVARVLTVKSAKIVDIFKEHVVIKTHEHINNTTVSIESKTDMKEDVENTIIIQWSKYGLPQDVILYGMNIDFGYGQWNLDAKWRDEELKSVQLPFGASKGTVAMASGQTVVSKLLATKVVLMIEIEFTAKLVGNIIGNYEQLFGKYHFWSPALENIMRAARLKNEVLTKSFLEMRFYMEPKISVSDKDSGKELNVESQKRRWRIKQH